MFYVPHMLFKIWESGKVNGIISGLHQSEALVQEEERITRQGFLVHKMNTRCNTFGFGFPFSRIKSLTDYGTFPETIKHGKSLNIFGH